MKKILFFYPHNLFEMDSGTHRRAFNLLLYFKEKKIPVDLLSFDGFTNQWGRGVAMDSGLIHELALVHWQPSFFENVRISFQRRNNRLPDYSVAPLKKEINAMLDKTAYSHVVISYAYWASLIDDLDDSIVKVIDLHDFITLNLFLQTETKLFQSGVMFQDEIEAISKFDYALSISEEEKLMLDPFCLGTKFIGVPISFPSQWGEEKLVFKYDLLFIGSDNPFNVRGMEWFMEMVYPLLPDALKIVVVGKVGDHLEKKKNITCLPRQKDLDQVYRESKIACCPLLGGTGLKIKVVEALSYGKPVVTTFWGLSGILEKTKNGCILANDAKEFAEAIIRLVNNDAEFTTLRKAAIDLFRSTFSSELIYKNLDSVFLLDHVD